ncbi:MAG: hypothetical protein ER33_04965 [Cyanobium sp. CACIAM 14]|nr:MAG: hypothetical protein ER33_04965 [Cyanobium sp. CACIAM 14]
MSDYFDALIRASGVAEDPGPGRPQAEQASIPPLVTPEDFGIQEIVEHRAVPAGGTATTITPPFTQQGSLLEDTTPAEAGMAPVEPAPSPRLLRPEAPGGSPAEAAAPESPRRDEPLPAPIRPPSGPARVRAALRWVADGEEAAIPSAAIAGRAAHPQDAAGPTGSPELLPPMAAGGLSAAPPPARLSRQTEFPATLPEPSCERPGPGPGPARAEAIEVSIGAIHVRLDAPQATTRVTPAPPAPVPSSPRSSLSRRVLWRI